MSNNIRLHKGLNIPIAGCAEPRISKSIISNMVAIKPTDFRALIPKLLVREGDRVLAGAPVMADKKRPEIVFVSPVCGTIDAIIRGEKRKLLEIRIKRDESANGETHVKFPVLDLKKADRKTITDTLLQAGMWPMLQQRPYGIIPNSTDVPRDIFISGFNTAPLAADYAFILKDRVQDLKAGIAMLTKLTDGKVYVSLRGDEPYAKDFQGMDKVEVYNIQGIHPAGNVGVQINNIKPVNKGENVWTINFQHLAILGRFIQTGVSEFEKTVVISGPRAINPSYVTMTAGSCLSNISEYIDTAKGNVRVVSGNVLTGEKIDAQGFIGFYDDQITLLEEGDRCELLGWAKPFRTNKFSISRSYFSWLLKGKKFDMDTNTNGGERAFVLSELYEKVVPMDIYPVYLLKAILANDIDKMEELGIYEVVEEDFALCEYICPSKIEVQKIISQGIETMIKEMA